jgi:hypothetical protein
MQVLKTARVHRYDSVDDVSDRMLWCTVSNLWQVMAC